MHTIHYIDSIYQPGNISNWFNPIIQLEPYTVLFTVITGGGIYNILSG
jgi:hypothetical protein